MDITHESVIDGRQGLEAPIPCQAGITFLVVRGACIAADRPERTQRIQTQLG